MKPKPKAKPPKTEPKRVDNVKKVRGRPFAKGNPGRPIGSKNFKEAYEAIGALMAGEVQFPGGVKRYLTGKEQVAFRRWMFALTGGIQFGQRAMDAIENRLEGLPVQAIKNLGDSTGRVNINITRHIKDTENPDVEIKTERTEPKEEGKNP